MKLTANYTIARFEGKHGAEFRIFNAITGECMVKIYIDGQIEFTYSNQKFGSSELIEIANLANSAHLLLK